MGQWLGNWKRVGPILDEERWARLGAMTPEDAQRITRDLLGLWQPDWPSDDSGELLLHQRVFARALNRHDRLKASCRSRQSRRRHGMRRTTIRSPGMSGMQLRFDVRSRWSR
jgi:hypothetical protein